MTKTGTVERLPLDEKLGESQAIAASGPSMAMFERFVSDPQASVEKIERMMALWERSEARIAEAAFNAAMSDAQAKMRPVAADAFNPQTRSKYASYEALDGKLRPIYTAHGFGLSFDTGECAIQDYVRVQCYVTHIAGHSRTYRIDMPADGKGAKGGDVMTKTHAVGAAMSYGMRYLLKMIFNVAVGEDDDDGNSASASHPKPAAPKGYTEWIESLEATAMEGWSKLEKTFKESGEPLRNYLRNHDGHKLAALKDVAQKVKA